MANIDIAAKNPGDQHTSTEFNTQISWANAPAKSLGAFSGAMDFGSQGQYDDFILTANLEITATNIALFNNQVVRITQPAGGTYNVTFGTGIDKLITEFVNPLEPGNYWLYMTSYVSPGGGGNGIHVNIPDVQIAEPDYTDILSMDKVLSEPVVSFNKDLSTFATNNTNSQVFIIDSFEDNTKFYAFCAGQSSNIANQDLTYLAHTDKTASVERVWDWELDTGVPKVMVAAGGPGAWDEDQLNLTSVNDNPDDITGDGKAYIGYYCANSISPALAADYQIGIVTSDDLITWTKYISNPVFYDNNSNEYNVGNTHCKVVRLGAGNYVMLYNGSLNGGIQYLNKATSTDGITWTVAERKILGGLTVNRIGKPSVIQGRYSFVVPNVPSGGNKCSPAPDNTLSNNTCRRYYNLFTTLDFNTFKDEGIMFERQQEIHEGIQGASAIMSDHNNEYFMLAASTKWDIQAISPIPTGEQYIQVNIIKAAFTGYSTPNKVAYGSNINFYDVTKLQETTGTGYTGAWGVAPQVDMINWIYPTTDCPLFSNYDIDVNNFAVKTKIQFPLDYDSAVTGGMLCSVRDPGNDHTNSIFQILLNGGTGFVDLVVQLWDSSGTAVKLYRTALTINTYIPSVAGNSTVDVGFIWDNGTLKICAGYNTDVTPDKTQDLALTQLNTSTASLGIGGNNARDNFAGLNMTGAAFLLGAEATEANWLKLSLF